MSHWEFETTVADALPSEAEGQGIVVGVSGGADSVALTLALHAIEQRGGLKVIAAHLNHGLRAVEADADEQWVADFCRRLDIPLVTHRIDVSAASHAEGRSVEEAARTARYEFLTETAQQRGCRFVAVAHTADDQVETVLHHTLRGTGLTGLRGMSNARPLQPTDDHEADNHTLVVLLRPLLTLRRGDIENYLHGLGQDYRHDVSNVDERFTRNRIRHMLLPLLRERFNPRIDEALLRLSQQAGDATDALQEITEQLLDSALVEHSPTVCRLNIEPLQAAGAYLIRHTMTTLWKRIGWPRQGFGYDDWARLERLVSGGDRGETAVTLPGNVEARRRRSLLMLRRLSSAQD